MGEDESAAFREARRHEPELNARQREVLRLIAAGRTNGEIASLLGMTLDGAKWNVSEILSKLGLPGREAAARYWLWRRGRLRRLAPPLRALLPAGAVKVIAPVAGLLLLTAVVFAAFQQDDGDEAYYLAGYVEATGQWEGQPFSNRAEMEWWYRDRGTFRLVSRGAVEIVELATRGVFYVSESGKGVVDQVPMPFRGSGRRPSFSGSQSTLGPSSAKDLDGFLRGFSAARVVGSDVLQGREVVVIEAALAPAGELQVRLWLLEEAMIVLRSEMTADSGELGGWTGVAEITRYERGNGGADALFEPPAGAAPP